MEVSRSRSLQTSPLTLSPCGVTLLPRKVTSLTVSFVFGVILSSISVDLVFCGNGSVMGGQGYRAFLPGVVLFCKVVVQGIIVPYTLS